MPHIPDWRTPDIRGRFHYQGPLGLHPYSRWGLRRLWRLFVEPERARQARHNDVSDFFVRLLEGGDPDPLVSTFLWWRSSCQKVLTTIVTSSRRRACSGDVPLSGVGRSPWPRFGSCDPERDNRCENDLSTPCGPAGFRRLRRRVRRCNGLATFWCARSL